MARERDNVEGREHAPEEFEPDYRFTLANERTFLAWQRTALGLLAAAVALVQLVPELVVPGLRHAIGGVLAALALLAAGGGLHRWTQVDAAIRQGRPLPRPRAAVWLGMGLIVISVVCLVLFLAKAGIS